MEALAPPDPTPIDAELLTAERDAELWEAFGRLRAGDQALLRLLVADPAPGYDEVAAALGMPRGSIGPTRARALERLRGELAEAKSSTDEAPMAHDRRSAGPCADELVVHGGSLALSAHQGERNWSSRLGSYLGITPDISRAAALGHAGKRPGDRPISRGTSVSRAWT